MKTLGYLPRVYQANSFGMYMTALCSSPRRYILGSKSKTKCRIFEQLWEIFWWLELPVMAVNSTSVKLFELI